MADLDPDCQCWDTSGCQTPWECSLTEADFAPARLDFTRMDADQCKRFMEGVR